MNANFKAKFLQNFVSKKKGNEGFTLIELLVVIIIVGVLAAIALPSFLNQIGKARGSEAKSTLGTVNRSQQAYRLENGQFGTLANLDAKITTNFFAVAVTATTASASASAIPASGDLKMYGSRVDQTATDTFTQAICESNANKTAGGTYADATPASATTCGANAKKVE
jgi:type IV pilus assembly protein PilA